ncbi:hypothetical protein BUALT_Bualt09G0108700 [Buddleja alternifolia]|uniref:MI domain-containing protein n=1 Tax=Buddleja alternifolia TaxID=168488 RepID=A0AAV6X8Y5_9LAMI|nr:hypothetical protein BUALT_Bualt09G0108700 [Buddleja alternifolia]
MPPKSASTAWPPRRSARHTARKSTPSPKFSTPISSPPPSSATNAAATAVIPPPAAVIPTSLEPSQKEVLLDSSDTIDTPQTISNATIAVSPSQPPNSEQTLITDSGVVNSDLGMVTSIEPEKTIHVEGETVPDPKNGAVEVAGSGNGKRKIVRKTVRVVKKIIKRRVPKRNLMNGSENGVNLKEVTESINLANNVIEKPNLGHDELREISKISDELTESSKVLGDVDVIENSNVVDGVTEKCSPVNEAMDESNAVDEVRETSILDDNVSFVSEPIASEKRNDLSDIDMLDIGASKINSGPHVLESVDDEKGNDQHDICSVEAHETKSNDVRTGEDMKDMDVGSHDSMEDEKVNYAAESIAHSQRSKDEVDLVMEKESVTENQKKEEVGLVADQNVDPVEENGVVLVEETTGSPTRKHESDNGDLEKDNVGLNEGLLLSGVMEALERKKRRKIELFVGGLDKDTNDEDIRRVFEKAGTVVDVKLVMNAKTGKNKGFAFVRFATAADAKNALAKYSKIEICGKQCGVSPVEGNDTIFLGNIDRKWKTEDVMQLLGKSGIDKIDKVILKGDPNNMDKNRGFAFVELETNKVAQIAFNKLQKNIFVKNLKIRVTWAEPLIEPAEEELLKVKSVYAEYLPSSWDEDKVKEYFKRFGEIENVALAKDLPSSRRKDFAFINYTTREAALACIEAVRSERWEDDGSKVKMTVSLAKPFSKTKQAKYASDLTTKQFSKKKPKSSHATIKPHEPRYKEKRASSSYDHAKFATGPSTTDELVQILRQQASNNHIPPRQSIVYMKNKIPAFSPLNPFIEQILVMYLINPSIALGTAIPHSHFSQPGIKRPFSLVGHNPLYLEPRGLPRGRIESSYPISGPSALSHGVNVESFPYHHPPHPGPGHPSESVNGRNIYPIHFQTREQPPYYGNNSIYRRCNEEKSSDKSRRERRKEARLAKNKKKFDSWVQHQQSSKSKKPLLELNSGDARKLPKDNANKDCTEHSRMVEKSETYVRDLNTNGSNIDDSTELTCTLVNSKIKTKDLRRKKGLNKAPKSSFFEYLQMEVNGKALSAQEDLRFERKLAKKLKVKNGRLTAANDDIDMLLEGIPSVLDYHGEVPMRAENDGKSKKSISMNEDLEDEILVDEGDEKSDSLIASSEEEEDEDEDEEHDDVVEVISPKDSSKRKRKKTKFEEYLEADIQGGKNSDEADLALERKLAKKLKVKAGKVPGDDDDLNMLFEGIPSALDLSEDEQIQNQEDYPKKSLKKLKNSNLTKQDQKAETGLSSNIKASEPEETFPADVAPGKYVAPHLRSHGGSESAEIAQVRKRLRGLLNRLSETNVESITGEISTLFHSVGRGVGTQIVSEEVVASCSGGPRGNEQYAAVFASFVAGMACLVGIDFGAKLLARLAKCFEEEYSKEDNLSLRNLTLLFSYLYVFGVCSSELIYDFLIMLSKRLTEVDVSTVLTVLQCCGMKLRGDDPVGMKNFILSVQEKVNELKSASENGQSNLSSKRMEFMIETICDIKNNKKRPKEDTQQHTRIKKWLQKLRVDDILIRGLKWSKLLDPSKKGQWWLSGDIASTTENVEEVAGSIDKEIPETKKMLQLAASQRMNTDARRAIFCVIMSGEDYVDAFEKLLRLDLPGKQDREIMRVLVECCLQEKIFNKYYCVLASKLCSHDKNHKFTLQYCLWDHFKELESMPLIRSMHLSKFTAEMVASFSLSLAVLKSVDLNDVTQLSPKKIMHFRMLFEAIFEFPDKLLWNVFTRIAVTPEYESLRSGIEFFISKYVLSSQKSLGVKFKIARKALNNVEGILINNRHQRRPSQGVFVFPDNFSAPLTEDIAPPPVAAVQAPPPVQEKSGGGVHLPPQPPAKPAEEMPTSDGKIKG